MKSMNALYSAMCLMTHENLWAHVFSAGYNSIPLRESSIGMNFLSIHGTVRGMNRTKVERDENEDE